jgi:hypothetical protein
MGDDMSEQLSVRMKTLSRDISDSELKHRASFMLDLSYALIELAERIEAMETPSETEKPTRGRRAAK